MASDSLTDPADRDSPQGAPDVTPAGEAAARLPFRAADVLEGITDAFFALDRDWRFTYVNASSERVMGRARADLLGRSFWGEFPAAGSTFEREYRRAVAEEVTVTFEEFYPPLNVWVEVRAHPSEGGLAVFYRDVTARKRAEEALRQSEEHYRQLVEGVDMGTWRMDVRSGVTTLSPHMAELYLLPPGPDAGSAPFEAPFEALLEAVHPEDRARVAKTVRRSVATLEAVRIEHRVVGRGEVRWVEGRGRTHADSGGQPLRFEGIAFDITERVERHRRERFLADLAERARGLTDPDAVIADAVRSVGEFLGVSRCVFVDIDIAADTCACHADYRADEAVASMAGVFPISAFGATVVAEYAAGRSVVVGDVRADPAQVPPESVATYDAVGIRAHIGVPVVHSARLVSCIGAHSATPRRWKAEEVELLQTVVERTWLTVEVLRQERALARETEATARILDSITDASFTLDREWRVVRVNDQARRLMTKTRDQILGRNFWEVFPKLAGSTFDREYRRAVAEGVPVSFEVFYAPLDAWLEVRAYPSPDGLSVFYQDVTARKRAEEERERLLAEQRARAEREALVNRINEAIRATSDPELIQETAAALVGEALGADRCYFSVYDPQRDAVRIARDWRRPDLPSVAGEYRLAEYQGYVDALYARGTAVVPDAQAPDVPPDVRRVLGGFGIRSLLAVPLLDGGRFAAALAASVSGEARAWTPEEVSLMEAVLTQTRTATEEARLRLREHRIAEQLQAALQPLTPTSVPGLALAAFYRPALEDEGVGGDFSDVFSTDKGVTFLVVGDLSGKGLAAASQVAMVRQMLRFALYNGITVAEPVSSLNATLADNGLLDGFSTVFVGRYDAGARALTYVNCGQDAGLVLRAGAGTVQALPPTGPVLGAIGGAVYAEETVTLEAGDVLALFTDGLTEAGPTRTALLTGDGVADLLRQQAGAADPKAIVAGVMAGVDSYAGAGVRDDQCLLVAIAQGL